MLQVIVERLKNSLVRKVTYVETAHCSNAARHTVGRIRYYGKDEAGVHRNEGGVGGN